MPRLSTDWPRGLYGAATLAHQGSMTNRLALWLGLLIVGVFALDALVLHWGASTAVMRLLIDLIRWLAFWR